MEWNILVYLTQKFGSYPKLMHYSRMKKLVSEKRPSLFCKSSSDECKSIEILTPAVDFINILRS
jgi:hypothetical protein